MLLEWRIEESLLVDDILSEPLPPLTDIVGASDGREGLQLWISDQADWKGATQIEPGLGLDDG
jgi:hypothetical protein